VEPDLGASLLQSLDEAGPQPLVRLDRGAVELVRMLGKKEERRRCPGAPLVVQDPVEAPEGVRPTDPVHGGAGQPAQLAQPGLDSSSPEIALRARRRALEALARPLPR
jgi:hypothetical protein